MSIVSTRSERFAYARFNQTHAIVDQQTQEVAARMDSREQAEAYRDSLNAWWARRPQPGGAFVSAPVFGMMWPEGPESAALLEMLDRLEDPERRLDVLEKSIAREIAA